MPMQVRKSRLIRKKIIFFTIRGTRIVLENQRIVTVLCNRLFKSSDCGVQKSASTFNEYL